jgi:hypothetical protein
MTRAELLRHAVSQALRAGWLLEEAVDELPPGIIQSTSAIVSKYSGGPGISAFK